MVIFHEQYSPFMKSILLILGLSLALKSLGQKANAYFADIQNFWSCYDSVQLTADSLKQTELIQRLYIDRGSKGLKGFILAKGLSASCLLKSIKSYPKFWNSIRNNSLKSEEKKGKIEKHIHSLKKMYPAFKQPEIYFLIGCLNTGGTTNSGTVLIASEIAAADSLVNASELDKNFQDIFRYLTDISFVVVHEIVHTQQISGYYGETLLARCLAEGSADFIAELVTEKNISTPYIVYGFTNEKKLWHQFQSEMHTSRLSNWLYNAKDSMKIPADLGYFMGYAICQSYYINSKNKERAIKEIIELSFDTNSIKKFLKKSRYAEKLKN